MNEMSVKTSKRSSIPSEKENVIPEPCTSPTSVPSPGISDLEILKKTTETEILEVLNKGNEKSLLKLKQVGKRRAQDVLIVREEHGPFQKLSDLGKIGLSVSQIESIFKVITLM